MSLNKFLEKVAKALPEICADLDLVEIVPTIFRSPANMSRLRLQNQSPRYFSIRKRFFYLREDVVEWLKNQYSDTNIPKKPIKTSSSTKAVRKRQNPKTSSKINAGAR